VPDSLVRYWRDFDCRVFSGKKYEPTKEQVMSKNLSACITAITFTVLLVLPPRVAAQHPRYRLVDIGTLGGPDSYGEINGDGIPLLNNSGVVGSFADTASPDPKTPNCEVPDCFVAHAFRWKDGQSNAVCWSARRSSTIDSGTFRDER
jgi:hypothetical protein